MNEWQEFSCTENGQRLDIFLAATVPELTRSRAQKLIEQGNVEVNQAAAKARTLLNIGDSIRIRIPNAVPTTLKAEEIPLNILFEDEQLIVIDKAAGLVVHPGAGNWEGTLVQALLFHCGDAMPSIGGETRPGIVHRIDKNTSGVLVVAKTDLAHQHLSGQFKDHSIDRRYIGLAWGPNAKDEGEYSEPIARDARDRKRMWIREDGKKALTRFKVIEKFRLGADSALFLFEAKLFTGRTHQIRVHFAYHGYPLVGDKVYAAAVSHAGKTRKERGTQVLAKRHPDALALIDELYKISRQFLHASVLEFTHPLTGERLHFRSPLPPELGRILEKLR